MLDDFNLLIRYADLANSEVRKLIKRLAQEGNLVAQFRMDDIYRKENPCSKCGSRGYLGADVDLWGCPNEGKERCPYCNGRGHSPDR